jgi:hypothetical protein
MNSLEKSRNQLVHFFFPFVERFYPFLSLALLLPAWLIPETYWQIRIVFFWLWFITSEIRWAGVMGRDYLPMQPGIGLFYPIYRLIDRLFFLLVLLFPVVLLIPNPRWLKNGFLGVVVLAMLLRAIGDWKYRPKKPQE